VGAKQKPNGNPFLGALVVAAIAGGLAGSWTVFKVLAVGLPAFLLVSSIYGAIRPKGKAATSSGNRRHGSQ